VASLAQFISGKGQQGMKSEQKPKKDDIENEISKLLGDVKQGNLCMEEALKFLNDM
jgi:hypothetical protein